MEKTKPKTPKGSSRWALFYAVSSLRNYPLRNMGIALILAIGVALPTTVFAWSNTGIEIAIGDYFSENAYQMRFQRQSSALYSRAEQEALVASVNNHPYIDFVHQVPSTICILSGDGLPTWSSYDMRGLNYLLGIKDARVILVNDNILGNWTQEFTYRGNFSLKSGQVLVSAGFVEYTREVHGMAIDLGSEINIDVITHAQRSGGPESRSFLSPVTVGNLSVAGVYQIDDLSNQIGNALPSTSRYNWDPLGSMSSVLGIDDSIMILGSEVDQEILTEIADSGYFKSALLVRASQVGLIQAGVERIGDSLLTFKTQTEEQFVNFNIIGIDEIQRLDSYVQTYLGSQILTVVALPVLIMSLMLTVFTSETSISRRKGEISALRSKGASFNQVFSTFMWESILLGVLGFLMGIGLSLLMAPLIGSTVGLFSFDLALFVLFFTNLSFPPLALVIAATIAMYLPAAYLLHVSRRIDVTEVGQPTSGLPSEGAEMTGIWRYALGLGVILSILAAMPTLVYPSGPIAVAEVLGASLLLFAASYLGSRTMRLVTARLSGETTFLLGEKSLYLSQSLRKRKGQFIPLLVILTLTMTTTTMMVIQSSSFESTMNNELRYSIGADMRVEVDGFPLDFERTLLSYPGVLNVTPVIETWAQVGLESFFFEGINPLEYLDIGKFSPDSFVGGNPETVLTALANRSNGVVISEYYSELWNRTVGDEVNIFYGTVNGSRLGIFEVAGIVRSGPGFGVASTQDLPSATFASQFGFQVGRGGFGLVNLDYIAEFGYLETADLFLVDTVEFADLDSVIEDLEELPGVDVFTPDTFDIASESVSIQLFLSGIQGLTLITFMLCLAMGLSAIALFLGSAVLEREPEYAIFRAIGGTKRQVIMMVFGEFAGIVVAAIGISFILGIVFGYSMSILAFGISPFSPVLAEILALPLSVMLGILGLEGAFLLASCYLPASRAGSVNPASALRNL
ncbi:MAG: FtsX-like permease family protein [Candidatus Thorarchaeota archaeon]|nr:MAG: FtsX-like permease family protein [Candidatus Thorarchaeota archaeon]